MKFSPIFLALASIVYGFNISDIYAGTALPVQPANPIANVENTVSSAGDIQTHLNTELEKAVSDKHLTSEFLTSYIIGVDAEINSVVTTIVSSLDNYSDGVAKAMSNYIITPYVEEVTKGAETLVANLNSVEGSVDARIAAGLIVNYQRLTDLATYANIDTSKLQELGQKVTSYAINIKQKRADNSDLSGIKGAINNFKETADTLMDEVRNHQGHDVQATLTALITGLDGQIDNLAATILNGLDGITFGLSGDLGDFLLGPIFQGLTNGAQVMIGSVLGGSIDMVTDSADKLFTSAITKALALGKQLAVKASAMEQLEDAQKQWISLSKTMSARKNTKSKN